MGCGEQRKEGREYDEKNVTILVGWGTGTHHATGGDGLDKGVAGAGILVPLPCGLAQYKALERADGRKGLHLETPLAEVEELAAASDRMVLKQNTPFIGKTLQLEAQALCQDLTD